MTGSWHLYNDSEDGPLVIAVCDYVCNGHNDAICIECLTDYLDAPGHLSVWTNLCWRTATPYPCAVRQRAERALARREQSRAYREWLPGARRVALAGSLSRGSHQARVVGRDLGARIASFL